MSARSLHASICAISLLVASLSLTGCIPHSTGPTEVGVRTVKWSPIHKKGVEDKVYAPGSTYFFVPFLNDWHTFDTRLQNLEMTATTMRGDRPGRDDLLFKTVDGNDIGLDVIINYRIMPEKAPMILQEVAENDNQLRENIVRTVTRSKPRDIFGALNTEQFYLADQRAAKAEEVQKALNEILEPYGVIVEKVSTRDYRFNDAYQAAIEAKKVADQQAQKFKSETKATQEEYLSKVESAKGDAARMKAEADGEYQRSVIEADAYYEQKTRVAQAIEAEGYAEAQGILKLNEALAGSGGAAMVKLQIAEALKKKRIVMLPFGGSGLDVRSTDINALLELYGIQKIATPGATPKPSSELSALMPAPAPPPVSAPSSAPVTQQRQTPQARR